jgi:hypothetical protein
MSHQIHTTMHMAEFTLRCPIAFFSCNSLAELVLVVLVRSRDVMRDKQSTSTQVGSLTHSTTKRKPSRQASSACSGVPQPHRVLHDVSNTFLATPGVPQSRIVLHDVSNTFPAASLMIIPALASPD